MQMCCKDITILGFARKAMTNFFMVLLTWRLIKMVLHTEAYRNCFLIIGLKNNLSFCPLTYFRPTQS